MLLGKSTRIFNQSSIAGILTLLAISNGNAAEIPTTQKAIDSDLPAYSSRMSLADTVFSDRSPSLNNRSLAQNFDSSSSANTKDIGLGILFGNSTAFGINGKFKVSDNFSVRPGVYFNSQIGLENKDIPANVVSSNSIAKGRATSSATGTSFGIAATYDFKVDPEGKTTVYLGPSFAYTSVSGAKTFIDGVEQVDKADFSETKIGLTLGADMAVSDSLIVGANVNYNFSRNLSVSSAVNPPALKDYLQSTGNSIEFGLRGAYRF